MAIWNYLDGAFDQLGDPMDDTEDTAPVDLADLEPGEVMSLVAPPAATLGRRRSATTYVIYDRGHRSTTIRSVMVYVSERRGRVAATCIGDLDGNVLQTSTP